MAKEAEWQTAEGDDGWEDVTTEKQIIFAKVGDSFTGKLVGWSETVNGIPQGHFTNSDGEWFLNIPADLKTKLKGIRPGWLVRMSKTGEQDTGQATPMSLFHVQFKRG